MNKQFVPPAEALALKELGFDEPCLCSWNFYTNELNFNGQPSKFSSEDVIQLPLFSQAFRWFRYNHWYTALILKDSFEIVMQMSTSRTVDSKTGEWKPIYTTSTWHKEEGLKSYDESELACLKQLIEMVKMKQK